MWFSHQRIAVYFAEACNELQFLQKAARKFGESTTSLFAEFVAGGKVMILVKIEKVLLYS